MGRFLKNKEFKSAGYGMVIPVGPTSLRPVTPRSGTVRFNTDTNYLEAYFTSNALPTWYPMAHIGSVRIRKDSFVGDGVTTVFTLTVAQYQAGQEAQVIVVVGNIFQNPGVAYTFALSKSFQITFTSPPPLGQPIIVLHGYASTDAD